MRIVLRIGGSVVASPVNTELISKYADVVRALKEQGHEVAVVVGGGALAREFIAIAKKLGLDEQAQDEIAISVSRLFTTFADALHFSVGGNYCQCFIICSSSPEFIRNFAADDARNCIRSSLHAIAQSACPHAFTQFME